MFEKLTVSPDIQPDQLADQIAKSWHENKVIHVSGPSFDDSDELRGFYDSVLEAVGTPVEIGEDATAGSREAQRTGQRWMEIRYDPSIEDAYRHSANPQPLHTDGSYIPSFPDAAIIYCQASADNGGETVFLDSKVLMQALETENPDLLAKLRSTVLPHARSGDRKVAKVIEGDDEVALTWNYYCVDKDVEGEGQTLREEFHNFLQGSPMVRESLIAVPLRPGDCVLWKDDRTLHGRNGFDPKVKSERFLWKSAVQIAND